MYQNTGRLVVEEFDFPILVHFGHSSVLVGKDDELPVLNNL